jgi:hypothetical protein
VPNYFFHVRDGLRVTYDGTGRDLPNLCAAQCVATKIAKSIIQGSDQPNLNRWVVIADEFGQVVLRVPFHEAMRDNAWSAAGGDS